MKRVVMILSVVLIFLAGCSSEGKQEDSISNIPSPNIEDDSKRPPSVPKI